MGNERIAKLEKENEELRKTKHDLAKALSNNYYENEDKFATIEKKVEGLDRFEPLMSFTISRKTGFKGGKAFMQRVDYNSGQFTKRDGRWLSRKEVLDIFRKVTK